MRSGNDGNRADGSRASGASAVGASSTGASAGGAAAGGSGMRLRLARQARGFSQQQLAGVAAVSRQAVSALEAGHSDPSLRVALAVARALGTTVEALFGPGELPPPVDAWLVAPLGQDATRVTLAPMGAAYVALPLAGATATRAGFLPAGGVTEEPTATQPGPKQPSPTQQGSSQPGPSRPGLGRPDPSQPGQPAASRPTRPFRQARKIRPIGPPRPTLVLAGCDPAMPLIETPLAQLDPPVAFTWWPCGSQEALELAADNLVHVAGAHLRGASGEYNTGPARELLRRQGADVVGFCSWREGLLLRTDLAGQVADLGDVVRLGLRLVNREAGSEARRVLDRELARLGIGAAQISGYEAQAAGHLQVAASIAAGLADVGVASEPAALAFGLAFVPLAAEHFDLVIPADQSGSREVQGLLKVLSSRWLLDQLASLPGYDPGRCGEHVASL
jgi:molybdate-binding protein/transcriptional regulator with XRE-family HTH domain